MTSKGFSNLNYSGFVIAKTRGVAQGGAGLLPNHVLLTTSDEGKVRSAPETSRHFEKTHYVLDKSTAFGIHLPVQSVSLNLMESPASQDCIATKASAQVRCDARKDPTRRHESPGPVSASGRWTTGWCLQPPSCPKNCFTRAPRRAAAGGYHHPPPPSPSPPRFTATCHVLPPPAPLGAFPGEDTPPPRGTSPVQAGPRGSGGSRPKKGLFPAVAGGGGRPRAAGRRARRGGASSSRAIKGLPREGSVASYGRQM